MVDVLLDVGRQVLALGDDDSLLLIVGRVVVLALSLEVLNLNDHLVPERTGDSSGQV